MKSHLTRIPLKKLWPYSFHDQTTWKYINHKPNYKLGITQWVLNPKFKYKRLFPKEFGLVGLEG